MNSKDFSRTFPHPILEVTKIVLDTEFSPESNTSSFKFFTQELI